jgi:Pectate lyase superfamily protein
MSNARENQLKLASLIDVRAFGATGDGVTDDTTAVNAAIAWAKAQTYGGEIYLPPGTYKVSEINLTSATSDFTRTIKLKGAGRNLTRIVPAGAGGVLLNMMGMNQAHLEGLHFDSTAYASQAAIFVARTTTSGNANNNQFRDVWVTGSYSKAAVVLNGSESSRWFNCRFENSNVSANHACLWTGGGSLIGALQSITTVNGGTVTSTNNPNTDNRMFGCEFYAPYNNARLVRFSQGCGYAFFGCTLIAGSADSTRLATYGDPSGARFNGPVSWHGCHFEVFGSGNTVHYLADAASTEYHGISSFGGYYVLSDNTAVMDYDRTAVAAQPVLASSTWTTPTTSPNSANTKFYVWALYSSSISFRPNNTDGYLYVPGFANNAVMDVTYLLAGATRFVGCTHDSVATALPTTGTYTLGELIHRESPVVGQPLGWRCTVSGTLGTLNGGATTGTITSGSNVLTVSSATGLAEGQRIAISGVSAGPYYIRKLSGTTAYLDGNANATVSGAAVSFSNATLVALANL